MNNTPIINKAQEETRPSIGSLVKNIAVSAAIFAATEFGIGMIGRGITKLAAPTLIKSGIQLSKIAAEDTGISASIAKAVGLTIKHEGVDVAAPSIGKVVSTKLTALAQKGVFGTAMKDFINVESKYKAANKSGFGKWMNHTKEYYHPHNVKSSAFSRFIAGNVIRGAKSAAEIPLIYGIDRTFGNLYGLDNEHKPPISDVGATFEDFAKFTGEVAPGLMLFKSLGPLARGVKYQTGKLISNEGVRNNLIVPGFKALARTYRKGLAVTKTFRQVMTKANNVFYEHMMQKRQQQGLRYFAPLNQLKNINELRQKGVRRFNNHKLGTFKKYLRTHIHRADEAIINNSQATYVDQYINSVVDVSTSNIKNKKQAVKNIIQATRAEINKRTNAPQSMLSYAIDKKSSVTVSPLERLRELAQSKIINDTNRKAYNNLYKQYEKKQGIFSSRIVRENFSKNITLNNHINVDGLYVDLNKRAWGSAVKLLSNVKIPDPTQSLSLLIGKPIQPMNLRPFHMLGIDMLNRRLPVYDFKGYAGAKLPNINAAGQFNFKEAKKFGFMLGGRPAEITDKGKIIFGEFDQTFRRVDNEIIERTARKLRVAGSEYNIIKEQARDRAANKNVAQTAFNIINKPKEGKTPLYLNTTFAIKSVVNDVKYKFELGEYGSRDSGILGNMYYSLRKFFDPRSRYNIFAKGGETSKLLNQMKNATSEEFAKYIEKKENGAYFIDKLLNIHNKTKHILEQEEYKMLMGVKASSVLQGLSDVEANGVRNHFATTIKEGGERLQNYVIEQSETLLNSSNVRLNKANRQVIRTAKEVASMMKQKGRIADIRLHYAGQDFEHVDFLRRAALLMDHVDAVYNKTNQSLASELFDNLMTRKSADIVSTSKFAESIGGQNPFKLRYDFSKIETKYNVIKSKNVYAYQSGVPDEVGDIRKGLIELFANEKESPESSYSAFFGTYSKDLDSAMKSSNSFKSLFTPEKPTSEYHRLAATVNDAMFTPYNGTYILDKINYSDLTREGAASAQRMSASNVFSYYMLDRVNRVASITGLAIDTQNKDTAADILKTWGLKRALPLLGIMVGLETLDQITDITDAGAFDEGTNVFAAEQIIKWQDLNSRIRDHIGITKASKYIEGLTPGLINSPGMKIARTVGFTFGGALMGTLLGNPAVGAALGLSAASLQDFGMSDLTKTEEENREIWSGQKQVPIKRGRGWTLSKTFFGGDKISGWAPHWFARLKSQYKYSEVLYGSKLEAFIYKPWSMIGINPIGNLIDPYHYEKKQYERRPYMYTGTAGEEIPFIGPAVAGTIGQLIKPSRLMHAEDIPHEKGTHITTDFLGENEAVRNFAMAALTQQGYEDRPDAYNAFSNGINISQPYSIQATVHNSIMNGLYQPMGLYGWAGKLASNAVFGKDTPVAPDAMIESANRMTSFSRDYWDQNMGDALLTNEFIRRMIPNSKSGLNPIPNNASWLPNEDEYYYSMKKGDPMSKIPLGEARLPGEGYERLHDVELTFPLGASSSGSNVAEMVKVMAGFPSDDSEELMETAESGTKIHRMVQDMYMANGLIAAEEQFTFDPMSNMYGYIDMRGVHGEVYEIKTIDNVEDLENLKQPKHHHFAQVNVYMHSVGAKQAQIIYVARDDTTQMKKFNVQYNPKEYYKTLKNVTEARKIASNIDHRLMAPGAGYSHLDRFKILADVAPMTKKYYSEKQILDTKLEMGDLTEQEYYEFYEAQKMAEAQMRPVDAYPDRFLNNNLLNPKPVYGITEENIRAKARSKAYMEGKEDNISYDIIKKGLDAEYNAFNLNNSIKDASEYNFVERMVGAAYEAGMHVQVPYVSRKFFQYWTPMEAYKRNILQGSKDAYWNRPVKSFAEPMMDAVYGASNPLQGAMAGATFGSLFGPIGGAIGALAGGISGAGRMVGENYFNMAPYIKPDVIKARMAERYVDDMTAISAKAQYDATGDQAALRTYQKTLIGSMDLGKQELGYFKGLASQERGYVNMIVQSGNEQMINELNRYLPMDNQNAIQAMREKRNSDRILSRPVESTYTGPAIDFHVVNDDNQMDKMKYQLIEDSGGNAFLSSLGWQNQLIKFRANNGIVDLANPAARSETMVFSEMEMKNQVYGAMRELGISAIVHVYNDTSNEIVVEIG